MKEEEVQEFKEWATSSFWSRWIEFLTHLQIMIRTDSNLGKDDNQWLIMNFKKHWPEHPNPACSVSMNRILYG